MYQPEERRRGSPCLVGQLRTWVLGPIEFEAVEPEGRRDRAEIVARTVGPSGPWPAAVDPAHSSGLVLSCLVVHVLCLLLPGTLRAAVRTAVQTAAAGRRGVAGWQA